MQRTPSAYHGVCSIVKYCDMAPTMITTQRERSVPMMHRSSPRRLRHSQRLQRSAMKPTSKCKLCNKKRWRNWITGGCEKGCWHRVSRIKEKRVMEGKVEYNVAWTGWGRNRRTRGFQVTMLRQSVSRRGKRQRHVRSRLPTAVGSRTGWNVTV